MLDICDTMQVLISSACEEVTGNGKGFQKHLQLMSTDLYSLY